MIGTTRYNNETWLQSSNYRERNQIPCMYCSPAPLTCKLAINDPLFIIEMNNSTNKILGIGYIRNTYETGRYYKVYDDTNYNRYVYKGSFRIDRRILETENPRLLDILDFILFKGKTHLKRGKGITLFPEKLKKHDICKEVDLLREIQTLFRQSFPLLKEKEETKQEETNIKNLSL